MKKNSNSMSLKAKNLKNSKNDYNIIVNTIQLKNPIVKEFFFGYNSDPTIPCDFKIADKYYCFFLSMKYHEAFPTYIENKLNQFQVQTSSIDPNNCIKFLFCVYDLTEGSESNEEATQFKIPIFLNKNFKENNSDFNEENIFYNLIEQETEASSESEAKIENKIEKLLTDLNFICMNHKATFILCYSGQDLAQYLYSLSQMHNNDYGQDRIKSLSLEDDLIDMISVIQKINKTDAQNLLSNFQDIKSIVNSSYQLLSLVPGMNNKKIKSIEEFFNFEFVKFKKNELQENIL